MLISFQNKVKSNSDENNNTKDLLVVLAMPWPMTDASHYYVQLRLSDKVHAIKRFVVCNSWDISAFRPAKLAR